MCNAAHTNGCTAVRVHLNIALCIVHSVRTAPSWRLGPIHVKGSVLCRGLREHCWCIAPTPLPQRKPTLGFVHRHLGLGLAAQWCQLFPLTSDILGGFCDVSFPSLHSHSFPRVVCVKMLSCLSGLGCWGGLVVHHEHHATDIMVIILMWVSFISLTSTCDKLTSSDYWHQKICSHSNQNTGYLPSPHMGLRFCIV